MMKMTPELSFQKQAEYWGHTYEILVKRGVLSCLIEQRLLDANHPHLTPWKQHRLIDVTQALIRCLGFIDDTLRARIKSAVEHLALTSYGTGYTATRAYLHHLPKATRRKLQLRALWCPLQLPGERLELSEQLRQNREAFYQAFALQGLLDPQLSEKGEPANADFALWLSSDCDTDSDYLLVQEYAFDMPHMFGDFTEQSAHLAELMRHRRLIDTRSVFARITAEVGNETFALSDDLKQHLIPLIHGNKPFYKLCQGCSYAARTARWLRNTGVLTKPCNVRALAITPNGLESLAAQFCADNPSDSRRQLMEQFGAAYRSARKLEDGDEAGLRVQVKSVFQNMLQRLPTRLRRDLKDLARDPVPGENYCFDFTETLNDFANPADTYTVAEACAQVPNTSELTAFFGQSAPAALQPFLARRMKDEHVTLRDLHAAAIEAGMQCSRPGRVNVIALEGNPGIGKTTAVCTSLEHQNSGYLFLYVSPRVVINRQVMRDLARPEDVPSGILAITTNASLITAAPRWYQDEVQAGRAIRKHVDGAVVVDGVPMLVKPNGSTLVMSPEDERRIESGYANSHLTKHALSEHEDRINERVMQGVLSSLATTTHALLGLNPDVNRVVITAALQGFRLKPNGTTTLDALSKLFKSQAKDPAGVRERRAFAARIPNIVVMVDELAGDGAGAPFVHEMARWLDQEFIRCFANEPSPFTVTLVIADASLANDVVLTRYLAAERAQTPAPDKILVSSSSGQRAFDLAVSSLSVGTGGPKQTLHVMTNSFPASTLTLDYRVQLTAVTPILLQQSGKLETARQAVRRVMGETTLKRAQNEICKALESGSKQIIYFAQDKSFLGTLAKALEAQLGAGQVAVLDNSVPPHERERLIKPTIRDAKTVFLMTSSGARGVSFPKTDCIIAAMPRFNIEASLMELAQLVYRGRGRYKNAEGLDVCGDHVPRRLVMLIDDYLIESESNTTPDPMHWLRQSLDLLTLFVMLRATLFTRITGDAGLRQPLALVPVGRTGVEDITNTMSKSVNQFLKEAKVISMRLNDNQQIGLVKSAAANIFELFLKFHFKAENFRAADLRTFVRYEQAREFADLTSNGLRPLLVYGSEACSIPEHIYFSGPVMFEDWGMFNAVEIFDLAEYTPTFNQQINQLIRQLQAIQAEPEFAGNVREAAADLVRILQRDSANAAHSFKVLKPLKSPSTWAVVPSGYLQFMARDCRLDSQPFKVDESELWHNSLMQCLSATSQTVMPPIPRYAEYPWAVAVVHANPLRLETVFDDRYFMASNEMNMLNTLLLYSMHLVFVILLLSEISKTKVSQVIFYDFLGYC